MRGFTARRTAALLVVVFGYYAFVIGSRAVTLLRDERLAFRGLGAGLLLLGVVGVALVVAEVRFGMRAERLARLRGPDTAAPDIPAPDLDAADVPARRTVAEADAAFPGLRARVEAAPGDWRAWYDLAVAYGDARDTRRGRAAMRRAIALERAVPPA